MKAIYYCALLIGFSLQVVAQDLKYPREITVAQDGSGNYQTIQEAVNSIRDLGQEQVIIRIRKGTYHEKLIIPSWKTKLSLIGEDQTNTIITNNDYSGKSITNGKDAYGNAKFSTYTSFTVLVQGNDVTIANLTIQNTAGKVGQAVALHVEGDRFVAKDCVLLGNQDTLYAATANSQQYYQHCLIAGTTDFIFGEATVVFEDCTIKSLADSYITAAATNKDQPYGFVFLNCKLVADGAATKVYLGRPWRPFAKTVFIKCELGAHIIPAGWDPWKGDLMFPDKEKTTFYAEYENIGKGAAPKQRVAWAKQLTSAEAKLYTVNNVLKGRDGWSLE